MKFSMAFLSLLCATVVTGCGGGGNESHQVVASGSAPTEQAKVFDVDREKGKRTRLALNSTPTPTPTPTTTTTSTPTPTPTPSPAPIPSGNPTSAPAPAQWQPRLSDTWQWQLSGSINTSYNVSMYDVDLFDTPKSTIDSLKARGIAVVCYFSAGSSENWRPDHSRFTSLDQANTLSGWAGERWLDTRSSNVREIMKARLDLAVSKGCDGVEPDNMDAYTNNSGFPLTAATQIEYARFIATEARARGLKVALKNTVDLLDQLEPEFDFAINEQCQQYSECGGYSVFISKGKPVFHTEYSRTYVTDAVRRAQMCTDSRAMGLRTLVLALGLDDSYRFSCD